ncbi:MAG: Plug domain-containing protein, partial [Gammaproteobacteria bacterium]|nr:Plug domain-containing protein [Gammaproteobacteria bacterium]
MNLLSSHEISWMTPGMYANAPMGGNLNPVYTIRGIGLNDIFTNNSPTVGLYIDEVIQPFSPMMAFQMFDLERIEVLK